MDCRNLCTVRWHQTSRIEACYGAPTSGGGPFSLVLCVGRGKTLSGKGLWVYYELSATIMKKSVFFFFPMKAEVLPSDLQLAPSLSDSFSCSDRPLQPVLLAALLRGHLLKNWQWVTYHKYFSCFTLTLDSYQTDVGDIMSQGFDARGRANQSATVLCWSGGRIWEFALVFLVCLAGLYKKKKVVHMWADLGAGLDKENKVFHPAVHRR